MEYRETDQIEIITLDSCELKQCDLIQQAADECTPPLLLNRDEDFIHRILRDHSTPNLSKVIVDNSDGIERIKKFKYLQT